SSQKLDVQLDSIKEKYATLISPFPQKRQRINLLNPSTSNTSNNKPQSLNFPEVVSQIQKSPPSISTAEPLNSQFHNPNLNPQEMHEDSTPLTAHTNQPTIFVTQGHPTIHSSHEPPA
ncbi:21491_t:CDS:1, partial [Racocetra persica]